MPRDLTDKTIVITGASSGIGAATAIACAEAGMHVVLNARRDDRLQEVAERVRIFDREAAVVSGDVTDPRTTSRLLEAAQDRFGGFHAVFANAGYGLERPAAQISQDDLRRIFDVNFFASVELLNAAATTLRDADRPGHLLMCSSCLAKFTIPLHSAYSATKAAQNHVCRAMRVELRQHDIEVSSVHPITTATEFFETSRAESGLDPGDSIVPDHAPSMFVQRPERVARAIVKCLRRPRAEVWTSHIVRGVAAAMTWSPAFHDLIQRRMLEEGTKAREEGTKARRHEGTK